jgi:hypothetical protein
MKRIVRVTATSAQRRTVECSLRYRGDSIVDCSSLLQRKDQVRQPRMAAAVTATITITSGVMQYKQQDIRYYYYGQ